MWFDPLRLTVTAFALLPCVTVAAPTYEIFENGTVLLSNNKHGLEKRSIYLGGWSGCDDSHKNDLINAWGNMLEMANEIKSKIDFEEVVSRDFLGDPKENAKYQNSIRLLIQHVSTWTFGGVFGWHMDMSCDDWSRKNLIKKNRGDESYGCPPRTAKADYYKCSSRCWKAYTNADGSVRQWVYRAAAYTAQGSSTSPVAYINWCPQWFTLPSCVDAYNKYSRSTIGDDKWNLNNYLCKEQVMMHELMHVDAHAEHATHGEIKHVTDRKIKVYNSDYKKDMIVQAYGTLYTKVLANWGQKKGGLFVATNADNLALYFLAKWIQVTGGYYPHKPRTNARPLEAPGRADPQGATEGELPPDIAPPGRDQEDMDRTPAAIDTPDQWDPITIVDGKVATGDINDLANALGLGHETADVNSTFVFADPDLDCYDLAEPATDGSQSCYSRDDDNNAEIELDASIDYPPQVPPTPTPTPKRGALNIILEQTDWDYTKVLRREMKWLFYPTAFGTASQCGDHPEPATVASNVPNTVRGIDNGYITEGCPILYNEDLNQIPEGCNGPNYINQIPFPGGTYNVGIDGEDCQYKNDGQGNAGAIWCGDKHKSDCKAHDDKDKANLDGAIKCDNLSHPSDSVNKKPAKRVWHRAVVACEW